MGRAYTEEDWQNMTVAERWNTDYDRMAYGWASEEEPRPAHLSDLGNSRMRELKKLQDTSHVGGKDNSFYTLPNPLNLTLGNTDNASNLLGSISKYIGDVSGFSDYIKDRDYARNQHIKDKRFQQAALSDGGITAYHPSNAPYNRNAKLRALQSGTFSRDPRTFKDDGTINSLGTASAKDVVLSKLMAEQNRMNNRVDNMFSNQVTDVGIPGYKPVQHTPNTGKFFDSMLSTAGSTREDFDKLTDEKKSKLRGLMSDYMLKYHNLPSGNKVERHGNDDYLRFNKNWWKPSTWFDGKGHSLVELWSPTNLSKGFKNWLENPEGELPAILPDWAFDSKEEELAMAKSMVENPYTTIASFFMLKSPAGWTLDKVTRFLFKGYGGRIALGAAAWAAAEEQGYDMSNFVKESVSSGKDKLGELLSKTEDLVSGEDSWNSAWKDLTNPTEKEKEKETEANGNKSNVPNTSGKKVAAGKGSWIDRLHQPVSGGAGYWDTNFNRGMEMLEYAGTPLSKRGDHPSKGWRASDTAARKALADVAKARLSANSKSIFGKVGQGDIEDSIKDDVFKALGGDKYMRWDPSDEELEQTISEAAIAIQLLVNRGMEYITARDKVVGAIK